MTKNYEGWFKVSKVYNFEEEKFGWKVDLPHSCDEWVITNGTHEESVKSLENFISNASIALHALRNEQELERKEELN